MAAVSRAIWASIFQAIGSHRSGYSVLPKSADVYTVLAAAAYAPASAGYHRWTFTLRLSPWADPGTTRFSTLWPTPTCADAGTAIPMVSTATSATRRTTLIITPSLNSQVTSILEPQPRCQGSRSGRSSPAAPGCGARRQDPAVVAALIPGAPPTPPSAGGAPR